MIKQVYADGRTVFTLSRTGRWPPSDRGREGQGGEGRLRRDRLGERGRQAGGRAHVHVHRSREAQGVRGPGARARLVRPGRHATRSRASIRSASRTGCSTARSARTSIPRTCPSPTPCTSAPRLHQGRGEGGRERRDRRRRREGLLQYAGGARLYTPGRTRARSSSTSRSTPSSPRTSGSSRRPGGDRQGAVRRHGHARQGPRLPPVAPKVVGTAGYNGDLGDADLALNHRGPDREIQDALKAGKLESAAFGSTDGADARSSLGGHGPRDRRRARAAALALFSGNVPAAVAAGRFVGRLDEQGRLTCSCTTDLVGHGGGPEGRAWAPASARRGSRPATTRARRARGYASPAQAGPSAAAAWRSDAWRGASSDPRLEWVGSWRSPIGSSAT